MIEKLILFSLTIVVFSASAYAHDRCSETHLVEDVNGGYVRPDLVHQIFVAELQEGFVVRFGYQSTLFADHNGRKEAVFSTQEEAQEAADSFYKRVEAGLDCTDIKINRP